MICQNDYHIVFLILLLSYITSLFGSELTLFGSELIFAHRFNKLFFLKFLLIKFEMFLIKSKPLEFY